MCLKSKTKTKNDPWAPAQPYILKGMDQTSQTYDRNQGRLEDMSAQAYDAFKSVAPSAFSPSSAVTGAQSQASAIGGGSMLGRNPGASTFGELMKPANDPSIGLLTGMANGGATNPATGLLTRMANGGPANPVTGTATGISKGKYLNAQPSASVYSQMMDQSYSKDNPFLDKFIADTGEDVARSVNSRFAAAGQGGGVSGALADSLSRNLATSGNNIRYQNYNDAENRRLAASGQSDAVWDAERGRMDAATGLLSDNFNRGQDRSLSAAQSLGTLSESGANRALSAAQSLGTRVDAGNKTRLDAAQAGDSSYNSQVQQMLSALGLVPGLEASKYAGFSPALGLLNSAADIPYVGTAALNGQIRQASNGYGTTTATSNPGIGNVAAGLGGAALSGWASGGFK